MEISVLGPLRVTTAGRAISLPAKQQMLLVILAFQPNRTVSTDRLIAALWGEDTAPSAIRTLQTHVFQLRRLLAPDDGAAVPGPAIVTDGRGYRLDIDPASIDARVFERLLDEGRAAAEPATARPQLTAALALWRGPRLPDVGDEPSAMAEIERLEELHALAFDELVRVRIALSEYDDVIPDIRGELSRSPFREGLWASLMLALVRSGRKAEALIAYRDAVVALRRELDVEPGHELQVLAARIRDGDPGLVGSAAVPAEPVGPTGPVDRAGRPSARFAGRRWRGPPAAAWRPAWGTVVLGGALLVALAVVSRLPGLSDSTPRASARASSPAVAALQDSVGRLSSDGILIASTRLGTQPDEIVLGAGSEWVSSTASDTVTRLDGTGTQVLQQIAVGSSPAGLAFGFGTVWVANSGGRTLSRISPSTNEVVATVDVGTAPTAVAVDDRWVWVTNRLDHTVTRIDPSGGPSMTFPDGATPVGIAAAGGYVWVADTDSSLVIQMDARTGAIVHEVRVGNGPSAVAASPSGDAVWVANGADGTVSRIDARSAIVTATTSVGTRPTGIAVGATAVWVAVSSSAEIVRVDPSSGQAIARYRVGADPQAVVADATGPVFTARTTEGTHRGGILVVASPPDAFAGTADPSYVDAYAFGLGALTNDSLVTYRKVEGPDGQTIVADLATSMPLAADGGRTWTFQLRRGITYSNGAALIPQDVPGSFERAMRPGGGFDGNVEIVGSQACATAATCDLSRGIVIDDGAWTVTFHLVEPDPTFPSAITGVPILPEGTPLTKSDTPLPATGPYMFEAFVPGQQGKVVRNPRFHVWSTDAQPDGFPDEIDWKASTLADPSTLAESGGADVVLGTTLSADRLAQLRTQVPAQLHLAPSQKAWVEMMNTNVAPFNDVNVRRAINYAADRGAIVDAWGGPLTARVTCQVIPPQYSGYEPYCPYTVDPPGNGSWIGPDIATARELIAKAHVAGMQVTVWGLADHGQHAAVAAYFTGLLNSLGFRATTRLLDVGSYFDGLATSPGQFQMAGFWLLSSTRSGLESIDGTFTCPDFPASFPYAGQPGGFCDRSVDADVRRVMALEGTDPVAANQLLARIDRAIVDQAPAVMAFNPTDVTVVSARVGNFQLHPVLQVLLDQLWVR